MNNRMPYVFYGIIIALYGVHLHADRNPCAVFSIEENTRPLPCIPFSQLATITYQNRPSLQSFIEEIRRNKDLEKKEWSLACPQLALAGSVAKTDFQRTLETAFPERSVVFQVRQLLWSFAGPLQQYRIQRSITSASEHEEQFHRATIRLESELTFLDALLNVRQKNRIEALDISSHSVFAQGQTKNEVGFFSEPMWLQAASDFAVAQAAVMRYQDDVKRSYSFLERALSIPILSQAHNKIPGLIMEHGLLNFTLDPVDLYLEQALHLRQDLAVQGWNIDRAEKAHSLLLNRYAPTVSFSFDVARNNFRTQDFGIVTQLTFQVGINASWTFDSFASAHEASATEAEMISLKMQQLDLSLEIQRDVKAAYYDLQALLKEVTAEKARYENAKGQFELQQSQFQIGQISEVDFKVAETDWQTAQYALDQREIVAEKKYRELLFACGYPPDYEQIKNLWSHK